MKQTSKDAKSIRITPISSFFITLVICADQANDVFFLNNHSMSKWNLESVGPKGRCFQTGYPELVLESVSMNSSERLVALYDDLGFCGEGDSRCAGR